MKKIRHTLAFGMLATVLSAPAFAGYAEDVAEKLGRGLCNSAFGWVEFGKNLYNEPTQHGPLYAPIGLLKGVAHTVGRTVTGAIDTASFMIPSSPFVHPGHVWENMETETSYGVK
jgi:putative exosortase-associated protein (TIGR04073 family)